MGALPHATNNVAEYHGLLAALDWCAEHGATIVAIRSDSLLLVQQMRGVYKVKTRGTEAAARPGAAAGAQDRPRHVRARPAREEQGRRPAGQPGDGRGGQALGRLNW